MEDSLSFLNYHTISISSDTPIKNYKLNVIISINAAPAT